MSLLFTEGFDWTDSALTGADLDTTYSRKERGFLPINFTTGVTDASIITGRGGRGGAWDSGNTANHRLVAPPIRDVTSSGEFIIGFAIKTPSTLANNSPFLWIDSGTGVQLTIRVNSNGSLSAYRGNIFVLGTSSTSLFTTDSWYYWEFKITIDDSTGSVEWRSNSETLWELTTVDTKHIANENWGGFRLNQIGNSTIYDDLYLCDSIGTINNDFLGDVIVETLFPASDGILTNWTPSAGGSHADLIDDAPFTAIISESDYVDSNANNSLELFKYTTLSAEAENKRIYGVQVGAFARLKAFSARAMLNVARIKAINSEITVSDKVREDVPSFQFSVFENEPANGVPWKFRDINNAQFGVNSGPN